MYSYESPYVCVCTSGSPAQALKVNGCFIAWQPFNISSHQYALPRCSVWNRQDVLCHPWPLEAKFGDRAANCLFLVVHSLSWVREVNGRSHIIIYWPQRSLKQSQTVFSRESKLKSPKKSRYLCTLSLLQ